MLTEYLIEFLSLSIVHKDHELLVVREVLIWSWQLINHNVGFNDMRTAEETNIPGLSI